MVEVDVFIEAGEAEEKLKDVSPFIESGWLRWREGDGAEGGVGMKSVARWSCSESK